MIIRFSRQNSRKINVPLWCNGCTFVRDIRTLASSVRANALDFFSFHQGGESTGLDESISVICSSNFVTSCSASHRGIKYPTDSSRHWEVFVPRLCPVNAWTQITSPTARISCDEIKYRRMAQVDDRRLTIRCMSTRTQSIFHV
jgi:hypothetical protein